MYVKQKQTRHLHKNSSTWMLAMDIFRLLVDEGEMSISELRMSFPHHSTRVFNGSIATLSFISSLYEYRDDTGNIYIGLLTENMWVK